MHPNDKAKVTIVMPSASPTGGAEEAFWQLVKSDAARELSWQTIFLEDGPLVEQVKPHVQESVVISCGRTREIWKWWKASGEIKRHVRAFKASLVLGWMTKGHVYGGLAAWRCKTPAAWFQMGLPENGLLDRVSRLLPAKAVFVCSDFVAGEQRAKQPKANVVSIPLGVDLTRFDITKLPTSLDARRQLALPLTGPIIGIVGRLQRWKGMHTLVSAMPLILKEHPDAICLIVGGPYPAEPAYESELRNQAKHLGICDRVIFAGAQQNVPIWMQAMDVFVHASNREPFGIVVVEAMALGKPVIACTPGGPFEIIESNLNGWCCEFEDHLSVSSTIINALASQTPNFSERVRNRACQFSQVQYSLTLIDAIKKLSLQ